MNSANVNLHCYYYYYYYFLFFKQQITSPIVFFCRFLDVRQQSFVTEWKVTTSSIAGEAFFITRLAQFSRKLTHMRLPLGG